MDRIATFLGMGGHAAFVWPALGLTAVVLIGMLLVSLRSLRANEAALRELEAVRQPRRRQSTAQSGVGYET